MCLAVDPDLLVTVNAMTRRLRRQRRPRRRARLAVASRHRAGRGHRLDEPAQGVGAADVRDADRVRAGRPLRAPAGRRPRLELDRDERPRRHRRPDPRRQVGPRRHAARRRNPDRSGRRPALAAVRSAGPDRRDRRGPGHRTGLGDGADRHSSTRPPVGTAPKWSRRRSTRPSEQRSPGAGTKPSAPSYLRRRHSPSPSSTTPTSRADRTRVAAMLWRGLSPDAEPRTQLLMPPLTWDLGTRRRPGDPDHGGDVDTRRAGDAASTDGSHRRERRGAAAGRRAAARRCPPATRTHASATASSPTSQARPAGSGG